MVCWAGQTEFPTSGRDGHVRLSDFGLSFIGLRDNSTHGLTPVPTTPAHPFPSVTPVCSRQNSMRATPATTASAQLFGNVSPATPLAPMPKPFPDPIPIASLPTEQPFPYPMQTALLPTERLPSPDRTISVCIFGGNKVPCFGEPCKSIACFFSS